jgi:hypothetical protein
MPRPTFLRAALAGAVAALAVTGAGGALDAQGAADRQQTVFVSAVDQDGNFVEDLTVDDVVVREDGRLREVLSVTRATDPMDVALLIDTSSAAIGSIQDVRAGVAAFLDAIGDTHRVALVTLASRPTIAVEYTTNRERLREAAAGLFALPSTAGTRLDALVEVARGLDQRDTERVAIVPVVFEGGEQTRFYTDDVLAALERSGASLHAITVGEFVNTGQEPSRSLAEVWERGPRASGGQRLIIRVSNALDTVMGRLGAELNAQYRVTFGRPDSLIPPEELEIEASRGGLTLRGNWARGSAGD